MNIALLITITLGVLIGGLLVKYDRQVLKAARQGGGTLWKHRPRIALYLGWLALSAAVVSSVAYVTISKAEANEKDFFQACFATQSPDLRGAYKRVPSNAEINYCHREWRAQPRTIRYGVTTFIAD